MTVIAACRFPWGKMRSISDATGGSEEALIFAADTRHTYAGLKPVDKALKIFPFPQANMLIAYCGEAGLAESCMEQTGERVVSERPNTTEDIGRVAQEVAVTWWPKRRVPNMQLIMMIGLFGNDGAPDLLKLGSESGFVPLSVYGPHAIGEADACETFLARIDRSLEDRFERGAVVAEPRAWATIVGGALFETIEGQPVDSTVGGKVQCYILDKDGIHGWGISRTRDGKDLEKITIESREAETYKKRYKLPNATEKPIKWEENDNPSGNGPFATRL